MKLIKFIFSLLFICSFAQTTNCFLDTIIYKTIRTSIAATTGVLVYNNMPKAVEKFTLDHAENIKNHVSNIKIINLKDYLGSTSDIANKLNALYKITSAIVFYEGTKISIDEFFTPRKVDSKE